MIDRKKYIDVRFSHLLGYSGVGAIVVTPNDHLLIIEDTNEWTDVDQRQASHLIPFVERIKISLGITQDLRTPPTARIDHVNGGRTPTINGTAIPAKIFPAWHICRKCGKLFPRQIYRKLPDKHCDECKGFLEQVRYVMVHPMGYISDVDWKFIAHRTAGDHTCERNDSLYFNETSGELSCKACGALTKFTGKEENLNYGRRNQQPWLIDCPAPEEHQRDGKAKIRKVNDISIYTAETATALVIPPESRIDKGSVVANLYANYEDFASITKSLKNARNPLQQKNVWTKWRGKYKATVDEIKEAYNSIQNGDYPPNKSELENITPGQIEEDEYKAFLRKSFHPSEGEDFVIHRQETKPNLPISDLIKADRLKEIRIFKGFKRDFGEAIVPPDITGKSGWLPAIEMWGEGIFFTIDKAVISDFEKSPKVQQLFHDLQYNYENSDLKNPNPNKLSARFVLLHTLSHILIRQLEVLAGYPAASIRERIYSQVGTYPMSGVLLYTTAPDKVGTLGGLAELSNPAKFYNLFENALRQANWCSSDPVCSEHELHGPSNLNRSACHACALLPETSCAYGNILLDRHFVNHFAEEYYHAK